MSARTSALCLLVAACTTDVGAASTAPPPGRSDTGAAERDARGPSTDGAKDSADGHARTSDASMDAARPRDPGPLDATDATRYRNPLVQPFASASIWNTPIGSLATYVPAAIVPITGSTLQGDEDVIVLTPTAASLAVYRNKADWSGTVSRCPYDAGPLIFNVPVPGDFVVGDTPTTSTPNSGLAVLLADGRTIKQTQPFARCTANAPGTSDYVFPDVDLYGDGIPGAHGGSGLSAIGGTLRVGELRPGGAPPMHALKLELWAAKNYYNDGTEADCYRWPATACDGYFNDASSALKYGGTNPSLRPGSLLALPSSVTIASLHLVTSPAAMIAWTLQNYGAYLVDDTAWSAASLCVENGPAGSLRKQFESDWGFTLDTDGTTSPFAKDMAILLGALSVVDDNSPSSIGGGGTPLQPPALPLQPVTGGDP